MSAGAGPGPGRRRPYWLVAAFVALMVAPQGLAFAALIAATVATALIRGGRAVARRRAAAGRPAAGSIRLGADRSGREVSLSDRQLSAHGLILGASGSGKSTTMLRVLTEQIRLGRPVVAIDMKGSPRFARELAAAAAAAGRPCRLWTPDGPGHWNPLQYGNATELKDKLIATERFTEPHYQRAAERYVQTVLQVLQEAHPRRAPTLQEVVQLMEPRRLPSMMGAVSRPLAERVHDYLAGLTPDQHSAIRGLGTRLAILTESHTGQFVSPAAAAGGAIDVRRALTGDEVVLFSLNSSKYGTLAAQLGTLVIQDLVSAAGQRIEDAGAGPRTEGHETAFVGLDEFSALGADHVISLLARGREGDMSVLLATQELVDLDRAASGLRDQVLGNTALKIIHRQDVPASAALIAQMVGTEKTWEETHQLGGRLLTYDTGRGTRRQVEQFIVHPNEIKALAPGDAIVLTKLPTARVQRVHISPPRAPSGSRGSQATGQARELSLPGGSQSARPAREVGAPPSTRPARRRGRRAASSAPGPPRATGPPPGPKGLELG
jgi:conjugal transfer pilus assembly protein TraD